MSIKSQVQNPEKTEIITRFSSFITQTASSFKFIICVLIPYISGCAQCDGSFQTRLRSKPSNEHLIILNEKLFRKPKNQIKPLVS
jgi:hypothetical protein